MDQSVATIALDAMPVLLLALSVVLLPALLESPANARPVRERARPRRR
jgi:hypothetical protein